jgi:hypothetical protein
MTTIYAIAKKTAGKMSSQWVQSRLGGASCRSSHVRNAPLATVRSRKRRPVIMGQQQKWPVLFDDLVGEREQLIWDLEAERLGSPEIDD